MASMYEMIMDLPLFKGVSKDHISQFLERTHVGFRNYKVGDPVVSPGEDVKMVRFLISGEINVIYRLNDTGLSVEEKVGTGRVLGADRLFGLNHTYPYKAVATTKVSIMEFSKEQYVNLLQTDHIYMLNFFNFLSLRAQRPVDSILGDCEGNIRSRMKRLVAVLTDPSAISVTVNGSEEALAEYCSCTLHDVSDWKRELQYKQMAECDSNTIKIVSRDNFLNT